MIFSLVSGDRGAVFDSPHDIARTFWGLRFLGLHLMMEFVVLLALPAVVVPGNWHRNGVRLIVGILTVLVVFHTASLGVKIG